MEYIPVDISTVHNLEELAEDVRRTNRPHVLRRADEDIAIIVPVKKETKRSVPRKKSKADIASFLASAGGWKDVDTDRLKEDIYESRHLSTKPRPDL